LITCLLPLMSLCPSTTLFRSYDPAVRAAAGAAPAGVLDRDRLARAGGAEGDGGLGAVRDLPRVRQRRGNGRVRRRLRRRHRLGRDRKSTRLNSSHVKISYAVF